MSGNDSARVPVTAEVNVQIPAVEDMKNLAEAKTLAEIEKLLSEQRKIQEEIIVLKKSPWRSPQVYVPLIIAIITAFGGIIGTIYGANKFVEKDNELKIEKEKLTLEISKAKFETTVHENSSALWEQEAKRLASQLKEISDNNNTAKIEKRISEIERAVQYGNNHLGLIVKNTKNTAKN